MEDNFLKVSSIWTSNAAFYYGNPGNTTWRENKTALYYGGETHPKLQLVAGRHLHLHEHLQNRRFSSRSSDSHGIEQTALGRNLPSKGSPPVAPLVSIAKMPCQMILGTFVNSSKTLFNTPTLKNSSTAVKDLIHRSLFVFAKVVLAWVQYPLEI